jgi:hypothetical protein
VQLHGRLQSGSLLNHRAWVLGWLLRPLTCRHPPQHLPVPSGRYHWDRPWLEGGHWSLAGQPGECYPCCKLAVFMLPRVCAARSTNHFDTIAYRVRRSDRAFRGQLEHSLRRAAGLHNTNVCGHCSVCISTRESASNTDIQRCKQVKHMHAMAATKPDALGRDAVKILVMLAGSCWRLSWLWWRKHSCRLCALLRQPVLTIASPRALEPQHLQTLASKVLHIAACTSTFDAPEAPCVLASFTPHTGSHMSQFSCWQAAGHQQHIHPCTLPWHLGSVADPAWRGCRTCDTCNSAKRQHYIVHSQQPPAASTLTSMSTSS